MRIVAIIAVYNERRFIAGCLEHLRQQGVEAYVIDNQSTDGTLDIVNRHLGGGVRGVETFPRQDVFSWRPLLRRKEELAAQLDGDWFLHLDADEIPLAPGGTLAAAVAEADRAGYNAIELDEFTFVPPRESPDHDHDAYRQTMLWYYPFAPSAMHLVRIWKRQDGPVDLASSGGHVASFPGRRISPRRWALRHYLFLSAEHARRKYVAKRYDADEVRAAWHGWRAALEADAIRLPSLADLRMALGDDDLDPSGPRTSHCLLWEPETTAPESRAAGATPERHPPPGARLPVVLCVVDKPGWAHDRKTTALERELAGKYRIVKRYQSELTSSDLWRADLVLLYYWLQVERLGELAEVLRRRRDSLLIGICSHFELAGAWRGPGLELLSELPRAVFANNLALVREFEPLLGRSVAYTPNGVDTRFFHPGPPIKAGNGLRVGWAGSLSNQTAEHRGVREVIEPAVARVPGAELHLAVREERWRDTEEMLRFYHSIDVYVCASRSEGTPNPCLEAAACGLPVVTTRVGNMPELIRDGENGFFVGRDVGQLAHRLRRLARAPALRARLGNNARRSIEAWDWRVQADHYGDLFAAVLENEVVAGR